MGPITGIVWAGPLLDRGGYGNVARSFAFGLEDLGVPVRAYPLGPRHPEVLNSHGERIARMTRRALGPRPLLVVHATPDAVWRLRWRGFSRTACSTIFETDRIPGEWPKALRLMDEVWVPSRFNEATFSDAGIESHKIKRFPYGIDTTYWARAAALGTRASPLKARPFRFLYCFAYGWRKGFDLLLRAYRTSFSSADNVELVLKVFGDAQARRQIFELFHEDGSRQLDSLPRLIVMDEPISAEGLRDLYATADFYVSTDRANGWGMPAMECMSMGVPSATIDWSGSTEFMTKDTALLIEPGHHMEPVHPTLEEAHPHQYRGHHWPAVSVESVRDALLAAYNMSPEERGILGLRGAEHIRMHFSCTETARRVQHHLNSIRVEDARGVPSVRVRMLDVRSLLHIYGPPPRMRRIMRDVKARLRQ